MIKNLVIGAAAAVLALTACQGPQGEQGPEGPAGPQGPGFTAGQSISSISPGQVFLGRAQELHLSGFATEWTDATTVNLGDGITVEQVSAASPTALVVRVVISETAEIGPRDVTVTSDGKTSTFKGFKVSSPLALDVDTLPQGGLAPAGLKNLDFQTPFDSASEFTATLTDGFVSAAEPSPFATGLLIGADVLATPGAKDFVVENGAGQVKTKYLLPAAVTVTSRAPTAGTIGTALSGTIANAHDTQVYSFNATENVMLTASVATTSGMGTPKILFVPASGKLSDAATYSAAATIPAKANTPWFLIVYDNTGGKGFSFELNSSSVPLTLVSEAADNGTSATAQVLAGVPAIVENAVLTDDADEDWFKLTIPTADSGKKLRARTTAGDAETDTLITIYGADATTVIKESSDFGLHENTVTGALNAGEYFVKVSASSYGTIPNGKYNLTLTLE